MSFLPPPPDPLRQVGAILSIRNQQAAAERQRKQDEDREFQQAIKLIESGASEDVVLANTTLAPNRAALAREVGKVSRKRAQAVEQAGQQEAIQRRAGQLGAAIAPRVAQGQPLGAANLALLDQANQQFGPGFEQELRPLVAQQVAEFEPPEAKEGRTEFERLFAKSQRVGGVGNLSEIEQRRLDKFITADDAELRATQLKAAVGSRRFNDLVDTHEVTVNLIGDIQDIRDVANRNPTALGTIGAIKAGASEGQRILGDIFDPQTANDITATARGAVDGALGRGNLEPELESRLFDISAKDFISLSDAKFSIATLLALQANPGGRISDKDVERQERRLGAGFRSAESSRVFFDRLLSQSQRKLDNTERKLRAFGRLGPDVEALIDAQIGGGGRFSVEAPRTDAPTLSLDDL